MKYLFTWAKQHSIRTFLLLTPLQIIFACFYLNTGAWLYLNSSKSLSILKEYSVTTAVFDSKPKRHFKKKKSKRKRQSWRKKIKKRLHTLKRDTFSTRDIILFFAAILLIISIIVTFIWALFNGCLLYTSPSPRDATLSRMPSSA